MLVVKGFEWHNTQNSKYRKIPWKIWKKLVFQAFSKNQTCFVLRTENVYKILRIWTWLRGGGSLAVDKQHIMGRSRSRSPSTRRRKDKVERSEKRKKRRSREREKERAELSHRSRHHEETREREFERSRSRDRDRSGRRSRWIRDHLDVKCSVPNQTYNPLPFA